MPFIAANPLYSVNKSLSKIVFEDLFLNMNLFIPGTHIQYHVRNLNRINVESHY